MTVKRKDKDSTQRAQRPEHRGHREETLTAHSQKERQGKAQTEVCATKENAPAGAGAHFSMANSVSQERLAVK